MSHKPQTLTLPLLVTKALVVFPNTQQVIDAGRNFSINSIRNARKETDSLIFVSCQKNVSIENPSANDIYDVGTLCHIISYTDKDYHIRIRVEVIERVKFSNIMFSENNDFLVAKGTTIVPPKCSQVKNETLIEIIDKTLNKNPKISASLPKNITTIISRDQDCVRISYALASQLDTSVDNRQKILESNSCEEIVKLVCAIASSEITRNKVEEEIAESVRESSEKAQKEYFLREKLKAIKKELGENDSGGNSPEQILDRIEKEPFPEYVKRKIKNELKKFDMMPSGSLEGALIQGYLDVLLNVPWYQKTTDNDDLKNVEKILDEDHYGLKEPKKRIVEYLAVKKLTGNLKSPILCFYGPPGTGKTSLGKSIARALGRKFFKASLGGISDEAEIRGHRRTYVGSMPGRIIQGMRKAGVNNPVFLLDEVDKVASSYKGDPASALLEVLDPEQNYQFNDNYLEEPYDLSDVLFIATANYLDQIPAALRDRLELIELSSYTEIEKIHIAKDHLIKKEIEANGLKEDEAIFTDDALTFIIRAYTREAGVRELERKIASCLRKVAVSIVKNKNISSITIDKKMVKKYLGTPIFDDDEKEKEPQVGVVTGLAYTQYGGTILPIEVNYFKGKGSLILTGHLGDIMKESASIALDYVKANAKHFNINEDIFENNDIHIHFPEGAVPKDGPSAGVAITIAIISCLSNTPVDSNVAMTGEVNLRGKAMPIGGLREKSLAALRSGIKTIIVPKDNKKDVSELPNEVKDNLKIVYMTCVDDAVKVALVGKK